MKISKKRYQTTRTLQKRFCNYEISFLVLPTTTWAVSNNSKYLFYIFRALNFEEALRCTKLALQYESLLENGKKDNVALNNSAGTVVNMCVILSKLGQ